jgi:glycosyltransferase involved in cell wall biosynthesis
MSVVRILLVSQMYPGPADPDLGVFVAQLERELIALGHDLEHAVVDHRGGGPGKHLRLGADAVHAAWRFAPDVVYAHFLAPAGALAAVASLVGQAPLVLTAHGRDVRNIGAIPGVGAATRAACRRATTVIAVSDYLRAQLAARIPEVNRKIEVVNCGVDLERFRGRDAAEAREAIGWDGDGPRFLFVGSLDERKNPLRLVKAFQRLAAGQLALVGDGPLRGRIDGARGVRLVGRVAHRRVADWVAASDILVLPSLVEPFGQALLEAMASERTVVATQIGGPPEFVTEESGVLVDPMSVDAIEEGLRAAAAMPSPNAAARVAAARHDVRAQARRVAEILEHARRAR